MIKQFITTHDGINLKYACSQSKGAKPWIILIIPFGLELEMVSHIYDFFGDHYRIVSWEARSILERSERIVGENECAVSNHVSDFHSILNKFNIQKSIIIGYCSGAGIALAAANRYSNRIENIILVHGEYTMFEKEDCITQFGAEYDSLFTLASKSESHLQYVFDKINNINIPEKSNFPEGINLPFSQIKYFRRLIASYLDYKSCDFMKIAKSITNKSFLISSKNDIHTNFTSSKRIQSVIPNSAIHIDLLADHYGFLRRESSTLTTIWNYLCEENSKNTK